MHMVGIYAHGGDLSHPGDLKCRFPTLLPDNPFLYSITGERFKGRFLRDKMEVQMAQMIPQKVDTTHLK